MEARRQACNNDNSLIAIVSLELFDMMISECSKNSIVIVFI